MKYAEIYRAMGYTVEVFEGAGGFGWSAQLDGEMDTATHSNSSPTEEAALAHGVAWAKAAIDTHSKRR